MKPSEKTPRALSQATMQGAGARIATLRAGFGLSQFARLLDVSPHVLEGWELGRGITREDLVLVADKTAASLHWLISGLEPGEFEALRDRTAGSLARLRTEKTGFGVEVLAIQTAASF